MKLAGRIFQKEFWDGETGSVVKEHAIQAWGLEFWSPEAIQHWVGIAVCCDASPGGGFSVLRLSWQD